MSGEEIKFNLDQLLKLSIYQELLGNSLVVAIKQNKTKEYFLTICGTMFDTCKETLKELEK